MVIILPVSFSLYLSLLSLSFDPSFNVLLYLRVMIYQAGGRRELTRFAPTPVSRQEGAPHALHSVVVVVCDVAIVPIGHRLL